MPSRHTLTDRLIGRQVLLFAILLVVVGASQYLILRAVLFASSASSLHDEISVLAPIIHHTMRQQGLLGFSRVAHILVDRLRGPGVEVVITNALGHVMASSSTLHAAVPPLDTTPYFIWHQRIVVDDVLGNAFYPSGYVWLLTSVHSIHNILLRDIELYAFLAAVSLALVAWLGSLSVRQTLRPLQEIRESTTRIASGEFGHTRELKNAPTELADLGDAINSMSLAIQDLFRQEKDLSLQMRRFVADASHELRTPLTAINGFLDLIQRGELTPEEESRGFLAMRNQGKRMAQLVGQLLTLSRVDSAPAGHVHPEPMRLDDWFTRALPELRQFVGERPLAVDIPDSLLVMADPDRMTEVMINLFDNIQRYTPPGTPVDVRALAQDNVAILEVRDHGPGVPQELLVHLFERFFRGDFARNSRSGGSGLGLSIVESLIQAQGGKIAAHNASSPDHGLEFNITLPLADPKFSQPLPKSP